MRQILAGILIIHFLINNIYGQKRPDELQLPKRIISADYNKVHGNFSQVFRECIGAGLANEGLRADWQQQLAIVQNEIGFKYIRMHGLLCDDMGVYKEDKKGNPIYNFQYIDQLYDYLLSIHLKPFVELAFMPNELASENSYVFWWKGNISPPKSYDKWADLIKHLVMHFQDRYGFDEVKTWYFEVWNEPDIKPFYNHPIEEYFKLYRTTAEAIKSISKEYRVGGPASAIPYEYEEKFENYCVKDNIPVDFISTHAYGVKQGFFDENGTQGTILDTDRKAVTSRMIHSREILNKSPLSKLELHFTEWSSSYTPTDYIHDTYQQAPFILDKIKGAQEYVNSMSYWVFTDIFEENGPRMTPFHGGFGLINYQGIKKPAYYAFQYVGMLGKTELVNFDSSSWVCKNNNGDIQCLFWQFDPIAPEDSTNDQVFYKKEQPAVAKGQVDYQLLNVPEGKYLVQVYKTGYRVNDAYTTYLDLGAPSQLSKRQVETIKSVCDGELPISQKITEITNGKFQKIFDINDNDVVLIILKKI
jgi:xylan 1,4-beta-xylosidase